MVMKCIHKICDQYYKFKRLIKKFQTNKRDRLFSFIIYTCCHVAYFSPSALYFLVYPSLPWWYWWFICLYLSWHCPYFFIICFSVPNIKLLKSVIYFVGIWLNNMFFYYELFLLELGFLYPSCSSSVYVWHISVHGTCSTSSIWNLFDLQHACIMWCYGFNCLLFQCIGL